MHGIDIIQASVASSATDFSLFSLFLQAHIVVKFVIFFLISASVWSWTIIIEKEALLRRTSRLMNEFEEGFWAGRSLEEFYRSLIHKPSYGMCA
ncbi:MAG: protein TolQ, partial [Alphaproteobacteria bacterium]|nr:protein TolQ [Alphaproteobacteria bacterium]